MTKSASEMTQDDSGSVRLPSEPSEGVDGQETQNSPIPELSEQGKRWEQASKEWEAVEQPQITVAQMRAALADVLDSGYQCSDSCDMRHPWRFPTERFPGDAEPNDFAIELRWKFIDVVVQRLAELREQEKSNGS
ncbi:MAG TPA: hypothetical protein VFR78_12485 [Pyrinomonadaceae bacterium]|nr:hypothetical protein [Pyrinomonadaceae bacterium]